MKTFHIFRLSNILDFMTKTVWKYTNRWFALNWKLGLTWDYHQGSIWEAQVPLHPLARLEDRHEPGQRLLCRVFTLPQRRRFTWSKLCQGLFPSLNLSSIAIVVQPKPFKWMLDVVWLNLVELSKQKTFREILSSVTSTEKEWKKWFDTDAPEEEDIPCGYQVFPSM